MKAEALSPAVVLPTGLCKELCIDKSPKPQRLHVGTEVLGGQCQRVSHLFLNIILHIPDYCFHRLFPKMSPGHAVLSDFIWCFRSLVHCSLQLVLGMGQKKPSSTVLDQLLSKMCSEQLTKLMALLLYLYSPTHCLGLTPAGHRMLQVF